MGALVVTPEFDVLVAVEIATVVDVDATSVLLTTVVLWPGAAVEDGAWVFASSNAVWQ